MADISNELDRIAEMIAAKSNKAVEEIATSLMELVQDKTAEDAAEILSGINLNVAMESKMVGAMAAYDSGIVLMLENMHSTATLSERALRALLENSKKYLASELIEKIPTTIMQQVTSGIARGQHAGAVLEAIKDVTPVIETQVVTAYGQYRQAITELAAQKLPKNTLFYYIGPYDTRTRESCGEKIEDSPMTYKQLIAKYGGLQNGIWNCRHGWEQASSSPLDQGYNREKFVDA